MMVPVVLVVKVMVVVAAAAAAVLVVAVVVAAAAVLVAATLQRWVGLNTSLLNKYGFTQIGLCALYSQELLIT
jgi:hypothetical protein